MNPLIDKADLLRRQAVALRQRSDELFGQAMDMYQKATRTAVRESEDKLINRKQAIELLWFDSYPSLRAWQQRVQPLGYLRFQDDKILRSEVLRFLDAYQSGRLHRELDRHKKSPEPMKNGAQRKPA